MKQYLTLNLEQQVAKNAEDIQAIVDGSLILGELGIKVVGNVDSANELPDPTTYLGAYGDAYLVGTTAPYDYYIFTRPFVGEDVPQWFNIGQFPLPGPQGEQGPAGIVTRGDRGSMWYVGTVEPGLFAPGVYDIQAFNAQDMYLNTSSGNIYQYTGSNWLPKGNITGPRGSVGERGQRGSKWYSGSSNPTTSALPNAQTDDMFLNTTTGNVYTRTASGWSNTGNIRGPQGEAGQNAVAVIIQSELASTDQLPPPDETDRSFAYIIDIDGVFHLFVITEDTETGSLVWTDMGPHGGTQIFVNGESVDTWNADTKLDKVSGVPGKQVYGIQDGAQVMYDVSNSGYANGSICQRGSGGTVFVGTPSHNNHAANKKYVDDAIANMPSGGSSGQWRTLDTAINTNTLIGKVIYRATKPGNGPPISGDVLNINQPADGLITLRGAWGSVTGGAITQAQITNEWDWTSNYLTMDPLVITCADMNQTDQTIVCRSYFEVLDTVETSTSGIVFNIRLHYYA